MGKFDNWKCHCSSIGKILTDPKSGPGLSETCKAHLLEEWIYTTYGRMNEIESKYLTKGTMTEEDGITLYSLATNTMYKKNTEVFENDFLIGTPDLIYGDTVNDIKSSWDIHTFFANLHKPINKHYVAQITGYMDIVPGIKNGLLTYVLVNTPDVFVEQEKTRLKFKMGIIDPDANPAYLEACDHIDKNSVFDDIPQDKRYIQFKIEPLKIEKIYTRVQECRDFLNSLV